MAAGTWQFEGVTVAFEEALCHLIGTSAGAFQCPGRLSVRVESKNTRERRCLNGSLGLQTLSFGARRYGCHCVFDGWMEKPSWKAAATTPAGRCAVVCTSFIEGITARRADDEIFFVLALKIGESEFVILTTDAKRTVLLGERTAKSEGFGSGRCPLYTDAAGASLWVAEKTAACPSEVASAIDEAARSNSLGLILGASGRGGPSTKPAEDPLQPSLLAMWGRLASKRSKDAEAGDSAGLGLRAEKKRRPLIASADAGADPSPTASAAAQSPADAAAAFPGSHHPAA